MANWNKWELNGRKNETKKKQKFVTWVELNEWEFIPCVIIGSYIINTSGILIRVEYKGPCYPTTNYNTQQGFRRHSFQQSFREGGGCNSLLPYWFPVGLDTHNQRAVIIAKIEPFFPDSRQWNSDSQWLIVKSKKWTGINERGPAADDSNIKTIKKYQVSI